MNRNTAHAVLARFWLALASLALLQTIGLCQGPPSSLSGHVTDPASNPVPNVHLQVLAEDGQAVAQQTTDTLGYFEVALPSAGSYTLRVNAPGFQEINRPVQITGGAPAIIEVHLDKIAAKQESTTVTADIKDSSLLFPDPAQRVFIREETLDANPGRPGAPISIPGLPIETASGGIKAPQYFSPGVAGDHGEPIAEYLQVGTYLLSNNLSSNAHGNGYADPNIMVPTIIQGVLTDGGAFNVREGNHAENLSAIYQFHSRLEPSFTITGDYRDVDAVGAWSPADRGTDAWVAVEAAYGNGFLDRPEHRKQYKINGFRTFNLGRHEITLFGIGYYGFSYVPGLVPIHVPNLRDTIDPRQKDQTHTAAIALNDVWRLTNKQDLQLSGLFRTYNLSLYSNFGDGLIRQSEFRTVTGANSTYINRLTSKLSLLSGLDYQRDAPRRLDLDHYESTDPSYYGPFQKVTANNVTLSDIASFVALQGSSPGYLHYYLGWRRDEILFDNIDLLRPPNSYDAVAGLNSPKATLAFTPPDSAFIPSISFSFGEAFYTNDPRIGTGTVRGTPVNREHAYQLLAAKMIAGTDLRITLGHITTEASLAKIDPDTGLQQDQGPGVNRFITLAARRYFGFGLLQASVSKADARDLSTGLPAPEAPRLIIDVLGTLNRLPGKLQARVEFEEVGAKPLGDGFVSMPVRELRGALLRQFFNFRMSLGVNFLLASGYTGQTTEALAAPSQDIPFEQVVGVRLPSYVSVSYTYNFRR